MYITCTQTGRYVHHTCVHVNVHVHPYSWHVRNTIHTYSWLLVYTQYGVCHIVSTSCSCRVGGVHRLPVTSSSTYPSLCCQDGVCSTTHWCTHVTAISPLLVCACSLMYHHQSLSHMNGIHQSCRPSHKLCVSVY